MRPRARRLDNVQRPAASRQRNVDGLRSRAVFAVCLLLISFGLMQARLVSVALMPVAEPSDPLASTLQEPPRRGDVFDRHGRLLATTLSTQALFADPQLVMDVDDAVRRLRTVLPDLSAGFLRQRLSQNNRFVWLKKNLTPRQVYAVNALGLPGIGFREEHSRVYPQGAMAAHLLGAVNRAGDGIAGIENTMNSKLAKGDAVHMTVDLRLQQRLHETLLDTVKTTNAKGAWGVTLDAKTAEVLAMVSLPDFDPNRYGDADPKAWRDRNVNGAFEMGSTFKVFTLAQALEEGKVSLDTMLDARQPLQMGKFRIRDSHPKARWMDAREVFQYSSNIGAARMIDAVGHVRQRAFLQKLHFDKALDTLAYGEARPLVPSERQWRRLRSMTISFGHGIAITPLHVAAATRALTVDGHWRKPLFVLGEEEHVESRIVSQHTVAQMRELMHTVVEKGTGRNARVAGYSIGGKTGTAEKNEGGVYLRDKHLSSFVGIMPVENPRIVTLIMVDEGLGKLGTGGTVAAPAFAKFAAQAAPILGILPESAKQPLLAGKPSNEASIRKAGYETVAAHWPVY